MEERAEVAIRAVQLAKKYRSVAAELVVFSDLHLEIGRGEKLALTGASGAGKSTLLHLMGGLDRPTEGAIFYGLRDICTLNDAELAEFRNREIGFVWQIYSLLPEFTALENVMMPLLIRGIPVAEARKPALHRLAETGLEARASNRAGELSGGEQQRVVLARALVGSPRVLLADEPTGNLDFKTGEMIMSMLDDLHRRHQLTSVYVTHNPSFAARCNRVLHLEQGVLDEVSHSPAAGESGRANSSASVPSLAERSVPDAVRRPSLSEGGHIIEGRNYV
jgi:lipoprotein-releasing system ATP-binding protein